VLVALQAENFGSQQLERAQEFAAAFEKERRIRSGKLDEDFGMLPLALFGDGRINRDAIFEF